METIRVERSEQTPGLATIWLNRPEKLNAISTAMHLELQEACGQLRGETNIRVVVLRGEGRAFSAGADLGRTGNPNTGQPSEAASPLEQRWRSGIGNRTCEALESLEQVTIGVANGLAIGGAVVFLSCCDIRVAAESAWFSIPEVDLDIPLTWNALPRLMRELGPARTRELVMTCDRFTSAEAERWGFLNRVHPDTELDAAVAALAEKLLAKDALSLTLTKTTTRALANQLVPLETTHADADYLVLSRLHRESR
ncbi:MAG: enoyl-CoA hydratase/isomerase family protein [Dehalococcoidia bacterium]|nr:enoyl-CoA hydratase/isomerase family protein [Dehalococcoidia bacterium]MCA9825307.1 enoyl-CoA hydratase/isomerase family protein [Dehalococcoidia bacterium]